MMAPAARTRAANPRAARPWAPAPAPVLPITLQPELCQRLDRVARARGAKASALAHRLLSVVLDDNLITAILDEGEDA